MRTEQNLSKRTGNIVVVDDFDDNLCSGNSQTLLVSQGGFAHLLIAHNKKNNKEISFQEASKQISSRLGDLPALIDELKEELKEFGKEQMPLGGSESGNSLKIMYDKFKQLGISYNIASFTFKPVIEGFLEKNIGENNIPDISIKCEIYTGQNNKNNLLQQICDEQKVTPYQVLFFDDSFNNAKAAQEAGYHFILALPEYPNIYNQGRETAIQIITSSGQDQNSDLLKKACVAAMQQMLTLLNEKNDQLLREIQEKTKAQQEIQQQLFSVPAQTPTTQAQPPQIRQINIPGNLERLGELKKQRDLLAQQNQQQNQDQINNIDAEIAGILTETLPPPSSPYINLLEALKGSAAQHKKKLQALEPTLKPIEMEQQHKSRQLQQPETELSEEQKKLADQKRELEAEWRKLHQEIQVLDKKIKSLATAIGNLKYISDPEYRKSYLITQADTERHKSDMENFLKFGGFTRNEIGLHEAIQDAKSKLSQSENNQLKIRLEFINKERELNNLHADKIKELTDYLDQIKQKNSQIDENNLQKIQNLTKEIETLKRQLQSLPQTTQPAEVSTAPSHSMPPVNLTSFSQPNQGGGLQQLTLQHYPCGQLPKFYKDKARFTGGFFEIDFHNDVESKRSFFKYLGKNNIYIMPQDKSNPNIIHLDATNYQKLFIVAQLDETIRSCAPSHSSSKIPTPSSKSTLFTGLKQSVSSVLSANNTNNKKADLLERIKPAALSLSLNQNKSFFENDGDYNGEAKAVIDDLMTRELAFTQMQLGQYQTTASTPTSNTNTFQ